METRKVFAAKTFAAGLFVLLSGGLSAEELGKVAWREDFSDTARHSSFFGSEWHNYKEKSAKDITKVFSLSSEAGNFFLHARHNYATFDKDVHLGKFFAKNQPRLNTTPILRWRWRSEVVPMTPDKRTASDTAATVSVVFKKVLLKIYGVKFKWSPEREVTKGFYRKDFRGLGYYVSRNASDPLKTWVSEKVDLCQIYKTQYNEKNCDVEVSYIGVLTDADDTKSLAEASYDDFSLSEK